MPKNDKYKRYLLSDEWAAIKVDLIQTRGLRCERCDTPKPNHKGLHVHHKTYKRMFHELPSDLMLVCPKCHREIHGISHKTGKKKKKSVPRKPTPTKVQKLESTLKGRDKALNKRYKNL